METPKALCGKVVNVVVWEPAIWKFISENIKVGCFLRLRNVSVDSGLNTGFRGKYDTTRCTSRVSTLVCLIGFSLNLFVLALALRDKSWICPMPDQTYEIRELLEEHNNRMSRNEYNPESGLLPFIPPLTAGIQQKQSLPGLGDGLLEFLNDRTTEIFVGVVEFRTFLPDFNGSYKPFCKPTNDGTGFMYRFAMVLADESTYVKVIVNNSVGEKIFRMTASVAVNTQSKRDDVEIVDKDTLWVARLRSVQVQKDRFFVLTGISEA